ncbi:TrkA C-terminal domain-containing protein [Pelagicoccus sp. SDUM812003]|uniref:TrkA C-terminal domain-containing protein n=1 Tax=Pelagicoccus sp. SDUM812003 TaxID=3041267 RepID=UPI00280D2CAC|nr:TrkA C-terminal domain-containing protein [Pelagicoccus sp. SDUM812003]MDQ8204141.1 TrkA C-terminal domain-containing protein [Pelagicoccus sp. SDUM812003]
MASIVTLTLVIGFSMLVTKIATIALVHTGMSKDRAQFQARSAFSGAGFTTSESEVVVKHPVRRRIITLLILFGNAGLVTAVSSLILGFVGPDTAAGQIRHVIFLFGCISALFLAARSQRLDRILSQIISKLLDRYANIRSHSLSKIMSLMGDFEVSEVHLKNATWLAGKKLSDLELPEEGLVILGIVKPDGSYIGVPRGRYTLEPEDEIIVYGKADKIKEISERPDRPSAEREHAQKVATHKEELRQQDKKLSAHSKP